MCNKKAAIKVFESRDNPNKHFYCCKYNECSYFRFWYPSDHDFKDVQYLWRMKMRLGRTSL